MNNELYTLRGLSKNYAGPVETLQVLKSIDLVITQGETVAVVGASGSGKSTLLHILGTLDTPSAGEILCRGLSLTGLGEEEKAAFRNREIGFVFQFHHLLAEFNTLENVAMQAIIGGMSKKKALADAARMLELVGLKERQNHAVTTLSGGERQRAAIARAMLGRPRVLLADEPTGNLDEKTGRQVTDLLLDLNRQLGSTLIIVTHNPEIAGKMQRCLELKDGQLHEKNIGVSA
ncbi:MAG: ABC transporter ATP-binding protein [Deltaproteobacteria bacterium]|jgi:lipoprotein-releasing system ATP-binding protein|nr:ABC transporter ATP-binding protein [Deltaproteobacteria bacterium]